MRNLKFVRYSAVLLGLVVLRTKAQNGFCPMCTKECCMVLTRSKPFWGQFWGQNGKADSDSQRSNKCAALVSLRNADTNITRFSYRKSSMNQYINFTLYTEVVRKHYSTPSPYPPLSPRETPLFGRVRTASARCACPAKCSPKIPAFRRFFLTKERLFLCRLCPDGFHLYRKSLH